MEAGTVLSQLENDTVLTSLREKKRQKRNWDLRKDEKQKGNSRKARRENKKRGWKVSEATLFLVCYSVPCCGRIQALPPDHSWTIELLVLSYKPSHCIPSSWPAFSTQLTRWSPPPSKFQLTSIILFTDCSFSLLRNHWMKWANRHWQPFQRHFPLSRCGFFLHSCPSAG